MSGNPYAAHLHRYFQSMLRSAFSACRNALITSVWYAFTLPYRLSSTSLISYPMRRGMSASLRPATEYMACDTSKTSSSHGMAFTCFPCPAVPDLVAEMFVFLGKAACRVHRRGLAPGADFRLGADGLVAMCFHELSLFPLELVLLEQGNPEVEIVEDAIHHRFRGIQAALADGRDDLVDDPPLERLGFRLAGTEDEGIQAGFGNDEHLLFSAWGTNTVRTLFVVIQKGNGFAHISKLQALAHVLGHKPRLALAFHDANPAEFRFFKNFQHVHMNPSG